MPLDLSEAVLDPDLGECFSVTRQTTGSGIFVAGSFQPGPTTKLTFYGIVSVAEPKTLRQVPEGDRVEGSMQIISSQRLYQTLASRDATSDVVTWKGDQWRVQSSAPWVSWGFWISVISRMKGA